MGTVENGNAMINVEMQSRDFFMQSNNVETRKRLADYSAVCDVARQQYWIILSAICLMKNIQ